MERSTAILERFKALYPREIDLSLDRMRILMEKLGHPEERMPPVIHIAGTNGKGSTTAFLRAMIEAAGKTVHVYTSTRSSSSTKRPPPLRPMRTRSWKPT